MDNALAAAATTTITTVSALSSGSQTPPMPSTLCGGRFLLQRELGRGSFGVVYEALDTATGRQVRVV